MSGRSLECVLKGAGRGLERIWVEMILFLNLKENSRVALLSPACFVFYCAFLFTLHIFGHTRRGAQT